MTAANRPPHPSFGLVCTRARRGLALVMLALVVLHAGPPAAAETLPESMQRIEQALAAGRAQQAETLARQVIRGHPGFAEAHGELARALEAQGRTSEALAVLLEVGQGLAHAELAAEGAAYLERAVRLAPGSAGAHAALGHALLGSRAYARAAEHLQRAMELGERGLAVRIYLGSALWESGQGEDAESVLRDALKLERSLPALQTLGGFLVWRGAFDEAIGLLEEASALDRGSVPLMLDLGRALDGAGRIDAAVELYRRVAGIDPSLSEPHYVLARLLRAGGDSAAARQEMEAFRRLHAREQQRTHELSLHRATLDAGWELLRQGRLEAAESHFRRLPESVDSFSGLAAVQRAAGDHDAEVRTLERALSLAPQRFDLKLKLARARMAASP